MKKKLAWSLFVLLVLPFGLVANVQADATTVLSKYEEVLWMATEEAVIEQGLKATDLDNMAMMGTGSWMKPGSWNPDASDIDATLGYIDPRIEKKLSRSIQEKARAIAKKRGLDPERINVISMRGSHPEKYSGEAGQTFFHKYSQKNAPDGKSAILFEATEENGQIGKIGRRKEKAEKFWLAIDEPVPTSFKQSWTKLELDLHFIHNAKFKQGLPPDELALKIAKYMEAYDSIIKGDVIDQFAPGETLEVLDVKTPLKEQMEALADLKKGGAMSPKAREAKLCEIFGVEKGNTEALARKLENFNNKAVAFMDDTKGYLEAVEKFSKKGMINNGADVIRVVGTTAKIKKILARSLGVAGVAIDAYAILDAGYNKGMLDGGMELSAALLSAGVPPAALAGVIAELGKEAFKAAGTWAGNTLIFDPINNQAMASLYFDTEKTAGCNLFSLEVSPFAIIGATRETLSYYFKNKERMATAVDTFMNREYCKGFVRAGAGDIRPMLNAQLLKDWYVSEDIGDRIKLRRAKLMGGGEIEPVGTPLEVNVNFEPIRPRSEKRARSFGKKTLSDGRATFNIQLIPRYFQRRYADLRNSDFPLYDAWGQGGMKAAIDFIEKNTKLEYKPYEPARLFLTVGRTPGWKIKTPSGYMRQDATSGLEFNLDNPAGKPEAVFRKSIVFIASDKAREPAVVKAKLVFNYDDENLQRRTQTYHFTMTAIPDGKQEPMFDLLETIVLDKQTGKPIHGARVNIDNESRHMGATTGPSGRARMTDIPFGSYDILATKFKYEPFSKQNAFVLKPARVEGKATKAVATIRLSPKKEADEKNPLGNDQPQEVAVKQPPKIIKGKGKLPLSFGADSYLPKGTKYAGQKVTYTANGPGTLSITFVYKTGAKSTSRYAGIEGGDRYFSSVHWNSPDNIAKKGRLLGGSLYRESGGNVVYLTETSSSDSIAVTGPGKIVFTAYPESTPSRQISEGKWYDGWYNATHYHYFGGSGELIFEFTGKAP